MPKFVIERSIPQIGAASAADMQAISQKSCGVLKELGPDVQWVQTTPLGAEDYAVDPALTPAFEQAIRRYWPGLPAGRLQPAYAGLRPKPHAPGEPAADFIVSGPAQHGVAGLVNLFGIESPGLTAAIVLGEHVAAVLKDSAA